jgi:hypothetical protein
MLIYLNFLKVLLFWIVTVYPLISFHQKYNYANKEAVLEKFNVIFVATNILFTLLSVNIIDFRFTLYSSFIVAVVYWIVLKVLSYFVKKKEYRFYR